MKKVVVSHPLYSDGMNLLDGKVTLVIPNNGDSDVIIDSLKDADGFILRIGKIDRKAIESCPNLRVITRPGVGYDNVDVQAATEQGIPVVICPSSNARAVAEHTLMLLLACSKNLTQSDRETRRGNFNIRNKYVAVDIIGKTLVLVGYGKIGSEIASMCKCLGMRIGVHDPYVNRQSVEASGFTYYDNLLEALAAADFVSLHMPLTAATRGMISTVQLEAMKSTAFLLNAARGDVVDEAALVKALEEKKIAGAGLDVLSAEPMPADHPLMNFPNVIITPHMAAQTQETASRLAIMAAEGTLAVLNNEQWMHVANPDVYNHPQWAAKVLKDQARRDDF